MAPQYCYVQENIIRRAPIPRDCYLRPGFRKLQRRFLTERIMFHKLVEEAQCEMIQHYLLQSPLELNEGTHLPGHEDPNYFIRELQTALMGKEPCQ